MHDAWYVWGYSAGDRSNWPDALVTDNMAPSTLHQYHLRILRIWLHSAWLACTRTYRGTAITLNLWPSAAANSTDPAPWCL